MTLPSQFSLEEENFYKDIQDLVKKGSQNEKELSSFLGRYMDLLTRVDIDDDTYIINFTKAAFILEASAKVYGSKVDRLWFNLDRVLESLKVKAQNNNKRKAGEEEDASEDVEGNSQIEQDSPRKLPNGPRRRKKMGEALSSPEDFLEIDVLNGMLGKNIHENINASDLKLKFHEKIPNLFMKNKTERKRIDVCLIKATDDRDDSRLRDWIVTPENMLVKEMYSSSSCNRTFNISNVRNDYDDSFVDNFSQDCSFHDVIESQELPLPSQEVEAVVPPAEADNINNSGNNNSFAIPEPPSESLAKEVENEKSMSTENRDKIENALNGSEEINFGRHPRVYLHRLEDNLVDINEVFWNSTRFEDVIPSKKMRSGKSVKLPCQLCCDKKRHKRKGKQCIAEHKSESIESFFSPHVQPVAKDSQHGFLPDEELFNAYSIENKLIEELGKVAACKNINEAYHPDESPEDLKNFLGFDGFENYLMKRKSEFDDDDDDMVDVDMGNDYADDNDNVAEVADNPNFELPFPVAESGVRLSHQIPDVVTEEALERSQLEYQEIIEKNLKDQNAAKSSFERNKELGLKISQWHSSLVDKIQLSQKRGALNMNLLAGKIMDGFPQPKNGEKSVTSFQELVKDQNRKDIPRYFLACLQLTNEGNVDIHKSDRTPLAIDCMMLTKLRATRVRQELDEYNTSHNASMDKSSHRSPSKTSKQSKRRRSNSVSSVSSDSESEASSRKKRTKSHNANVRKRKLSPAGVAAKGSKKGKGGGNVEKKRHG